MDRESNMGDEDMEMPKNRLLTINLPPSQDRSCEQGSSWKKRPGKYFPAK